MRYLVATMLLGLPLSAFCQSRTDPNGRWVLISANLGETVLADSRTVERNGSDTARMWVRLQLARPQRMPPASKGKYSWLLSRYEFVCGARTFRIMGASWYALDGEVLASDHETQERVAVLPESRSEMLLDAACGGFGQRPHIRDGLDLPHLAFALDSVERAKRRNR